MRILMVIPQVFYSTRGTPLSAYHRTRELTAMGQEVDILTYPFGADPPDLTVRVFRSRGPHFRSAIRAGPSYLKIWFDALLFVGLLARLVRRRYDCLYAHEEGAFMCRIAGAIFRVPYVYDMHSSLPLQITEWEFSKQRWVIGLLRWVERFSVTGARAVVAISPAVAEAARQADSRAHVITIVNYFGTGTKPSQAEAAQIRERHGIDAAAPLVVYTGSFVPLQALDTLLEAVPMLIARVPRARVLLVGGAAAELADYQSRIDSLQLGQAVTLVPAKPQEEMPAYMAAADVLVSPRIRGINPPGKLFTYLASGKPVVAADTLVHNQLISNEAAILYPPSAAALAEALTLGLTDSQRRAAVIAGAQAFIQGYCSPEARREAYRELLFAMDGNATGVKRAARRPSGD